MFNIMPNIYARQIYKKAEQKAKSCRNWATKILSYYLDGNVVIKNELPWPKASFDKGMQQVSLAQTHLGLQIIRRHLMVLWTLTCTRRKVY